MRRNNLIICSLPGKTTENLLAVLKDIGNFLGCKIKAKDIDAIHRLAPNTRTNEAAERTHWHSRDIVVKFVSSDA